MKYLLKMSYLGCDYHGFQIQENAKTVAGTLKKSCETLFNAPCTIHGCSRTDTGVHALVYFATCDVNGGNTVPCDRIPYALNHLLPSDISVSDCCIAPDDFNPRHTEYKEYRYIVHNSPFKDPFLHKRAVRVPDKIDEKLLDQEAQSFIGTHDFSAFMATGSPVNTTVRTVKYFNVERDGDRIIFSVAADGFLYNMVRIMVGTLLDISKGKIQCGKIPEIIEGKDRTKAGITAPPDGLYLAKVIYKENFFTAWS